MKEFSGAGRGFFDLSLQVAALKMQNSVLRKLLQSTRVNIRKFR